MSDSSLYFRQTNRASFHSLWVMFVAVPVIAALLGAVYGWLAFATLDAGLDWRLKFALRLGMIPVAGLIIGGTVRGIAAWQRIRNKKILAASAGVSLIFAEYGAFVTWLSAWFRWNWIPWRPGPLQLALEIAIEEGPWMYLGEDHVVGGHLIAHWVAEFVVLGVCLFATAIVGYYMRLYCEGCSAYLDTRVLLGPFSTVADPESFRRSLESGEFKVLNQIVPIPEDSLEYCEIDMARCSKCGELVVLSIWNTTIAVTDYGLRDRTDVAVIENLIIDVPSFEELRRLGPQR